MLNIKTLKELFEKANIETFEFIDYNAFNDCFCFATELNNEYNLNEIIYKLLQSCETAIEKIELIEFLNSEMQFYENDTLFFSDNKID